MRSWLIETFWVLYQALLSSPRVVLVGKRCYWEPNFYLTREVSKLCTLHQYGWHMCTPAHVYLLRWHHRIHSNVLGIHFLLEITFDGGAAFMNVFHRINWYLPRVINKRNCSISKKLNSTWNFRNCISKIAFLQPDFSRPFFTIKHTENILKYRGFKKRRIFVRLLYDNR